MNSIQLLSSKVNNLLDHESPLGENPPSNMMISSTSSDNNSTNINTNAPSSTRNIPRKPGVPPSAIFGSNSRQMSTPETQTHHNQIIEENEDDLEKEKQNLLTNRQSLLTDIPKPRIQSQKQNQKDRTILTKIAVTIFNIIIFIPSALIFKPFMKLWSLVTFPLRFLEEKEGSKDSKTLSSNRTNNDSISSNKSSLMSSLSFNNNAYNSVPSVNTQNNKNISNKSFFSKKLFNSTIDDEYDDVATIYSMATNTTTYANSTSDFKSPTSTSHIMYLLSKLPKPFFAPLNFNPAKYPKKTLILDLDETLIHSLSRMPATIKNTNNSKNSNNSNNNDTHKNNTKKTVSPHMVEVRTENGFASLYYVYKRPFCDEFLRLVSTWFNVYIFTASTREYADPVVNFLEKEEKFFLKRFYREHCTYRKGAGYIKDLSVVGSELSKVILVDNSPISYSLNYENAIDIEGWIDDPTDSELLQLLPILNALRFVTDVRYVLGLKNGEDVFRT